MKLLIALLLIGSVFAQKTGDLRYTDSLEIFLDGKIKGWFNFDSLYQTRSDDGYVYLGNMTVININQIQAERERFKVFMEEYLFNNSSQLYDIILIEEISRMLDKSLKRKQK